MWYGMYSQPEGYCHATSTRDNSKSEENRTEKNRARCPHSADRLNGKYHARSPEHE